MTDSEPDRSDDALPTNPDELFAEAIDDSVDPYRREAAIKRLGTVSGSAEQYLDNLASGAALSPIERSLATTVLDNYSSGDNG